MVSRNEVEQVAENSRLNLDDEEVERLKEDLEDILESFEALDEMDTEGVEPSLHPIEHGDREREDEEEESLEQEEALSNSENTRDGYFKGPRSVE
ncbi:MAG: Asp-tRNA(Asn)/Glu-tRNA(Gln) amidotransferase subunit GatC [Candidatus Nanohaloarchaeota archaeon QJJ-7]|nr:Asp-tRNA(Asn)/Glu-tRNA(Gln) amidotransferase subunit GatC [Candidatus Nanohaloarchaeota archaeon QJJ-7]